MSVQFLRQNAAALLLLLLLVAATVLATFWQLRQETDQPALATFSNQPDGARALLLWAEALGYATVLQTPGVFAPPADARIAFIMEPQIPGIAEDEWAALEAWMGNGGTLVLVGEGFGTVLSLQAFDVNVQFLEESESDVVRVAEDLLTGTPALLQNTQPRAYLESDRTDFETLLTVDGNPAVIRLARGQGYMIISVLPYPLSNRGLKEPDNAAFVLDLLALAGESEAIWFDEWHHGVRTTTSEAPVGLGQWITRSRPGQAILYMAVVLFLWLALSGTRLGPPLARQERQQRRAQAEHALALANLSRRAGHLDTVRDYYRRSLKQALGERYGLSLTLSDREFVQKLATFRPQLDVDRLNLLLTTLRQDDLSESKMLEVAQQVTTWINQ